MVCPPPAPLLSVRLTEDRFFHRPYEKEKHPDGVLFSYSLALECS